MCEPQCDLNQIPALGSRATCRWFSVARLRESPIALQVVAVAWLAWFALGSWLYGGDAPLRIYVQAFVILLAAAIFLLRGSRIAWALVVLANGVTAISVLSRGDWGWGIFHLTLLVVLFTPQARRYVWRRRV
jgi:hypothetical protein